MFRQTISDITGMYHKNKKGKTEASSLVLPILTFIFCDIAWWCPKLSAETFRVYEK